MAVPASGHGPGSGLPLNPGRAGHGQAWLPSGQSAATPGGAVSKGKKQEPHSGVKSLLAALCSARPCPREAGSSPPAVGPSVFLGSSLLRGWASSRSPCRYRSPTGYLRGRSPASGRIHADHGSWTAECGRAGAEADLRSWHPLLRVPSLLVCSSHGSPAHTNIRTTHRLTRPCEDTRRRGVFRVARGLTPHQLGAQGARASVWHGSNR